MPAEAIRELAHAFAKADRAMICWTLGITEHHNAVDNVLALINLALLTGHVGKYGSGLNPLRGQNNVQGGGDMGAIPDRLPGFQHVENDRLRAKFEQAWGVTIPDKRGRHLTAMCDAMACGDQRLLYVIGENPAQSEADQGRMRGMLEGLEFLVVQDLFLTKTAELADVVLPAAAAWAESEGTVTNSERRVQRVRKAKEPPGDARDDLWIIAELARRMGSDWGWSGAEDAWNELRTLSPMHAGMSYARLEALDGIQWPCYDENHPGELFLHSRLWEDPVPGMRAPFVAVEHDPPVDRLDDDFPIRLTTGRRLDSYNTGVQTAGYTSPLRRGESLDISPEDAAAYGLVDGERVCVTSRRGQVEAPIRIDESLRPGLTFMTLHFQDEVATNLLTIDAWDPKSGTAEFKATAIRIEKLPGGRTRRLSRLSAASGRVLGMLAQRALRRLARPAFAGSLAQRAGSTGEPQDCSPMESGPENEPVADIARPASGVRPSRTTRADYREAASGRGTAEVVRVVAQRARVALGRAGVRQEQVEQDPHRVHWTAVTHERKGQEHARRPVLRVFRDGGLEDLDRLAGFAHVPEGARQLDAGCEGHLGIETAGQRSAVRLDGLRLVSGGVVGRSEVIEGDRVIRASRQHDLEERDGLVVATAIDQGLGRRDVIASWVARYPSRRCWNAQRAFGGCEACVRWIARPASRIALEPQDCTP